MPLTYSSYLKLDQLLNLQEFRSKDRKRDELLFPITHQVYELWFKQVLHETDHLIRLLGKATCPAPSTPSSASSPSSRRWSPNSTFWRR